MIVSAHTVPLIGADDGLVAIGVCHLGGLLKLVQGVGAVGDAEAISVGRVVVLRVGAAKGLRHLVVGQGGLGRRAGGGDGSGLGGRGGGGACAVLLRGGMVVAFVMGDQLADLGFVEAVDTSWAAATAAAAAEAAAAARDAGDGRAMPWSAAPRLRLDGVSGGITSVVAG